LKNLNCHIGRSYPIEDTFIIEIDDIVDLEMQDIDKNKETVFDYMIWTGDHPALKDKDLH